MKKLLYIICLLALAGGCASSGVVQTEKNQYMITKTDMGDVWHTGAKVLAKLYIEANEYCAKQGQSVEKISEETNDGKVFVRNANATLRFRCVP